MVRDGTHSPSHGAFVSGVAGVLLGIIVGYVIAVEQARPGEPAIAPPSQAAAPAATPVVNDRELQALRDILANDPTNVRAAVQLGNRLYDAGRFAEAVTYYDQAFSLDPSDPNVSTDLATALWYLGRTDEALAQLERSLAIDSTHPQTLFNLGIIRRDGQQDLAGALEAWERLQQAHPASPEAQRAGALVEQARQELGTSKPTAPR